MDYFGQAKDDATEPRLKVKWPCRPVNVIEGALLGCMIEAAQIEEHRAPMVFIEEDQFANADEYAAMYGDVTAHEALALRDIIGGEVVERFRRQLILARELGGNPALYFVACEVEGLNPIIERKTP